jgi:acetylornithine deacetylase/succinyl-diaminopimelate desuccinylase-like protein
MKGHDRGVTVWATRCGLLVMVVAGALTSPVSVGAQDPARVASLLSRPDVQSALEFARATEADTIASQIRYCEVPAPPFQEEARAAVLRRDFEAAGLTNVRVDRAGNVLGDRPGSAGGPRVVVAAHLDTVFPPETPVAVVRDGATLRGPGIADNCRGLAVLVAIVRALNHASVRTDGPVTFVANVGEEGLGDLRGVKMLFDETLMGRIDRFVSIDGAGIHATNVSVGSLRYKVTFTGPGGHSFGAFGLANPANALGRAVARIAELRVPASPRTTFNVGRIGGGTSVNAIPFEAWMEVDLRSSDTSALQALDAQFKAAVSQAVRDENARWGRADVVRAEIVSVGNRPAGSMAADAPIVTTARAVGRALGLSVPLGEGSTDANLPMSLGIPAVTIGGGGAASNGHALGETFNTTGSWRGTQNAVLLTVALTAR